MTKRVNPAKASIVDSLKNLLSQTKSVAIVDYTGLKVTQASDLRRAIKAASGSYVVAKNTLFKLAAGVPDLKLDGVSGFVFSLTDEVAAIKAVADFAKKNSLPTFKSGLLGTRVLSASEVALLAATPDKPTLISKLLGTLKSPLYRATYSLNWNVGQLVRTLDAVAKSKEVN